MRDTRVIGLAAVVALVGALGTMLVLGPLWAGQAILASLDDAFAGASYPDLVVSCPLGLTADDLSALEGLDGVEGIETAYAADGWILYDGLEATVRVLSLAETLNVPEVVEGALPQGRGEVALLASWARDAGVSVGDKVSFSGERVPVSGRLGVSSLKVVGLVRSADHLSLDSRTYGIAGVGTGVVDCAGFVTSESFAESSFHEGHPIAYVRCGSSDGGEVAARVTALGQERAPARRDALRKRAQESVDEAKKKVEDAKAALKGEQDKIAEGEQAVQDAEATVASVKEELDQSTRALADVTAAYAAEKPPAEGRLNEAKQKLDEAQKANDEVQKQLDEARKAQESKEDVTLGEERVRVEDLPSVIERLSDTATQKEQDLSSAKSAYEQVLSAYNDMVTRYEQSIRYYEQLIAEQRERIGEGDADLSKRRSSLDDGMRAIREKTFGLEDLEAALDARERTLAAVPDTVWEVRDRDDSGSMAKARALAAEATRPCMALALVCMVSGACLCASATMRLARALARRQGEGGAESLNRGDVTRACTTTSTVAAVVGALCGCALAVLVVEPASFSVMRSRFDLANLAPSFSIVDALVAGTVLPLAACAVAWLSCRRVLSQDGELLLAGEVAPSARTRWFERLGAWRRASLGQRLAIETCLNDGRRTTPLVLALVGCTMLVVGSLVPLAVLGTVGSWQYGKVYGYDAVAELDSRVDGSAGIVSQELDATGARSAPVLRRMAYLEGSDGSLVYACMTVPANRNWFDDLFHLTPTTGGQVDLSGEGAWVSTGYGAHVGDVITLRDHAGQRREVKVLGCFASYLRDVDLVMGEESYKALYGVAPQTNALLVDSGSQGVDELSRALGPVNGLATIRDELGMAMETLHQASRMWGALVLACVAVAGACVLLAVLPAGAAYTHDKRRELEVLRGSGLSKGEVRAYLWRDTAALVAWGVLIGALVGVLLGCATVLVVL